MGFETFLRVLSVDFWRFLAQFSGRGGGEVLGCWLEVFGRGLGGGWLRGGKEDRSEGSKGLKAGASPIVVSLSSGLVTGCTIPSGETP